MFASVNGVIREGVMLRVRAAIVMLAAVFAALGVSAVRAAGPSCAIPGALPAPHVEGPTDREPQRVLPIGSYTLSLIWMPQKCRKGDEADCALYRESVKNGGRRDGMTLHGLWPDGTGAQWPQWCKPADLLPAKVISEHVCATPSPQLLQHEFAKHGTCMTGYSPHRYFDLSNRLAAGVRIPDLRALSYRHQTAATVSAAIAAANPGMTAEMMRLNLDKEGWLQEVWFCLDKAFKPQTCPATQGGARGEEKVLIWRGGKSGEADGERRRYRRGGYRRY